VNISTLTPTEFSETLGIFKSDKDAEKLIKFFINQSTLCHQVNSSSKDKSTCFRYKVNACYGACDKQELPETYNLRVEKVIATFTKNTWPFNGKIAIKEMCYKTNSIAFHIIHNWNYTSTINSLNNINELPDVEHKIDVGIYL